MDGGSGIEIFKEISRPQSGTDAAGLYKSDAANGNPNKKQGGIQYGIQF